MAEPKSGVPLDRDGRERPLFVTTYPQGDPRLDGLVEAFERGDFRRVKSGARLLLADTAAPEIRNAAEDLLRRTRPHPLILVFLTISVLLFLFTAVWTYAT